MSLPRVAVLAVLATLGAGCRRDAARRASEEALAAQQSVPLPLVPATRLPAPPLRLRILVRPDAIDVDAVDLLASWPEKRRARVLQALPEDEAAALPFVHRGLVRIAGGRIAPPDTPAPGQLEIRALADVLAYARELERRHALLAEAETDADPAPGPRFAVNVYAAADTPYEILVSVLYTVSQSEYEPTLVARGPGGDVALPLASPGAGGASVVPRILFRADGLSISLEPLYTLRLVEPALPGPGAAPPTRRGRPILAADRACPSVPLRDGSPDLVRLRALLGRIHERIPHLDGALIVPAADTPWRSVAGVAAVTVDAGLTRYMVSAPRGGVPASPCDGAIAAGDLQPDDVPANRFAR